MLEKTYFRRVLRSLFAWRLNSNIFLWPLGCRNGFSTLRGEVTLPAFTSGLLINPDTITVAVTPLVTFQVCYVTTLPLLLVFRYTLDNGYKNCGNMNLTGRRSTVLDAYSFFTLAIDVYNIIFLPFANYYICN